MLRLSLSDEQRGAGQKKPLLPALPTHPLLEASALDLAIFIQVQNALKNEEARYREHPTDLA